MSKRFPDGVRRSMLRLQVVRRTAITPHLLRLTVGGDELAGFVPQGRDQCIRVFFPRPGQSELRMPTLANNGWAAQFFLMPQATRPYVRNSTVRTARIDERELDIDFVVHGDGPAATWASSAEIGSPVGLFDEGSLYAVPEDASAQLLVADESALPAAVVIAEGTPAHVPTTALIEVPSREDVLDLDLGSHVRVEWLPRDDPHVRPGMLALAAALDRPAPSAGTSVFIAGESALATGVRRGLVAAGTPKAAISFTGYWRLGRAAVG